MTNSKTYTTEDADRLLGLADQFLDDWAEDAVQGGERDEDYEQRVDEWAVYRPLFLAAPAMLEALIRAAKFIEETLTCTTNDEYLAGQEICDQADAIIAKARGGAA